MSSTELERYESSSMNDRMEYARMISLADDLVPTGFHDPVMREINGNMVKIAGQVGPVNSGKVFLAFEYGAMLGLHPLAALMGIHVIEGKPAASAGLISSLVRTAGHRLRVTTSGDWDAGTFEAKAELTRADDADFTFTATWTRRDAERAGLLGKDNWKKYPASMSKARAVTAVAREGAEEALLGVHYTPEELGANVDANGEVVVLSEADHQEAAHAEAEPAPAGAPRRRATNGRQGTKRKTAPVDAPATPEEAVSATQEDEKPAEDIVDADVVEEAPSEPQAVAETDPAEEADRIERERIAAEQEAAARAADEAPEEPAQPTGNLARNADALPGETEPEYQHRKLQERQRAKLDERLAEEPAPEYRDTVTGQTFATQQELDDAIKARHADTQTRESLASWNLEQDKPALASAYEVAADEEFGQESPNYERLVAACVNQIELRSMYDRATGLGHMTTALRALVISRKAELPES